MRHDAIRNTSREVVEQNVEVIAEVDLVATCGGSFGNLLAYVPRLRVSAG
jgi:hypothetical protein